MNTTQLHGYRISKELTTNNAGFCRWGFCEREGRKYFLKEFLSPVYPLENGELSEKTLARKRRICEEFYAEKKEYYDILSDCRTGNNILIQDFFRYGSKYYAVTEKVEADGSDPDLISNLSWDKQETLLRAILFSLSKVHNAKLVHADIKADNILLKKTKDGFYTAKIIDFDSGFIVGRQPANVQGDFTYLAPETFLAMRGDAVELTDKIDIFALGILFHQYLSGKLPEIGSEYRYIHEAVLDGGEIQLSNTISSEIRFVLGKMLSRDPEQRPTAAGVLLYLSRKDSREDSDEVSDVPEKEEKEQRKSGHSGFYIPEDLD